MVQGCLLPLWWLMLRKKHRFFSKELDNEEKQILVTLRKDLEKVRDLVIKFGDIGSDRIAYIDLKLYKLAKVIDKKLNYFDVRDAKRKVLPKARLMVYDGDMMQYLSFKKQILEEAMLFHLQSRTSDVSM